MLIKTFGDRPAFLQDASGTAWDSSATTGKKPITLPYSIDADVSTNFSPQELKNIINIWRRVAEDYAPFNVDVTTEYPGERILGNSSNPVVGIRVSIGDDLNDWCVDCGGGIAYVNKFGSAYYNPGKGVMKASKGRKIGLGHNVELWTSYVLWGTM